MINRFRNRVVNAMKPTCWDLGNKLLYDLCRLHPSHDEADAVLAKIWLIGRSYAAAIERRKEKGDPNDDFYVDKVAPKIQRSKMDSWINKAKRVRPGTTDALNTMIEVHANTTDLLFEISDLKKRSLASKYLHFHVPKLFYIYDSRAVEALAKFSFVMPKAPRSTSFGDDEYRKFTKKCDLLRQKIESEFGLLPTPRQLDNLLLSVNEK